ILIVETLRPITAQIVGAPQPRLEIERNECVGMRSRNHRLDSGSDDAPLIPEMEVMLGLEVELIESAQRLAVAVHVLKLGQKESSRLRIPRRVAAVVLQEKAAGEETRLPVDAVRLGNRVDFVGRYEPWVRTGG